MDGDHVALEVARAAEDHEADGALRRPPVDAAMRGQGVLAGEGLVAHVAHEFLWSLCKHKALVRTLSRTRTLSGAANLEYARYKLVLSLGNDVAKVYFLCGKTKTK